MKSIFKLMFLLSVMLVVLVGCQNMPNLTEPQSYETGILYSANAREIVPAEYPIWAGQNILAGTLSIYNDDEYLWVTFSLIDGWLLTETHVHVAATLSGIPQNHNGTPIPGHFDYKEVHNYLTEYTEIIDLSLYDFECEQTIVIAAHAVVVKLGDDDEIIEKETAWGGDEPGPGPRWWFYAEYTIQCNGNGNGEGETAYGGDYPGGGAAWWYYFDTEGPATQAIYAGQNLIPGASVTYDDGYLIINLGPYMSLQAGSEPVKIQGYAEGDLPSVRPPSGLFTTYKGTDLTVMVPYYRYYVIHLDVLVSGLPGAQGAK
ncbi:MAG: hypothetical protein K0B81_06640 [Candidatus Cloacimonetes bacterium]|nr:hypothetical protein [Candidatus Cloacimonadota bacterium]